MLPGIRILFALVALSFAILIFGFGALALLRSAHQHLASQPAWQQDWRTPVEIANARRNDRQAPAGETQTLALLRVDPPIDATPTQPKPQNAQGENPPVDAGADLNAPSPPLTSASIADTSGSDRTVTATLPTDTAAQGEKTGNRTMNPAPPPDDPGKVAVSSDPPKAADLANPSNDAAVQLATGPDASTAPVQANEGESPHASGEAGSSPAKPEAPIELAALPDTATASNEPSQLARQQTAKQPDAAELRTKRRARARLRARRLAQARAQAARLAQTQPTSTSSYYNSNFTTTGSGATGTTNATPFGAPRSAP